MSTLTQKDIDLFAQKILEDYDLKDPGKIFKSKVAMSISEALLIQSTVSKLRKSLRTFIRSNAEGFFNNVF